MKKVMSAQIVQILKYLVYEMWCKSSAVFASRESPSFSTAVSDRKLIGGLYCKQWETGWVVSTASSGKLGGVGTASDRKVGGDQYCK